MRIFLDVGAHDGETLDIVLNPKWGFDVIHCFEPALSRFNLLKKFHDKRLVIHLFGLSSESKSTILYGAGHLGGSIYGQKLFLDPNIRNVTETIRLESVSNWVILNTNPEDQIYLKLNCEGSESDILENLILSGHISRFSSIYVDFDIRKVPGQEHRQFLIENDLNSRAINFYTPDKLGLIANPAVDKWLSISMNEIGVNPFKQIFFTLGLYLPFYLYSRKLLLKFAPKFFIKIIVKKFGLHSSKKFIT
jgi:FkbM family methyltransferase